MYKLRNDVGVLIAEIDERSVGKMMQGSGRWEEKTFLKTGSIQSPTRKTVFVFSDNFSYTLRYETTCLKLFIWENYYLELA